MKSIKLGNLEEIILLLVGVLKEGAYSVAIVEEYKKQTGKNVNISAIHNVLYRLEEKGFLESRIGNTISERGGKRKRLFSLTPLAVRSLEELAMFRDQLRQRIPELTLNYERS